MADYEKFKCVFCGNEQVSRAGNPRCTKCNSRRLNRIEAFSAAKLLSKRAESISVKKLDEPLKNVNSEVETMSKNEEQKKDVVVDVKEKHIEKDNGWDLDRDILGDDGDNDDDI